jgi:hypothetical protein
MPDTVNDYDKENRVNVIAVLFGSLNRIFGIFGSVTIRHSRPACGKKRST